MNLISPTLCLEFLVCPRHFEYKRKRHLSLVLPHAHLLAIHAHHVIQHITVQLLNHVFHAVDTQAPPLATNTNQILEMHYKLGQFSFSRFFTELEEQVLAFLLWFFDHFCFNSADKTRQVQAPLMVYERISAPSLGFVGQPSAVFKCTDQSLLILVETYRPAYPFNDMGLQAAVYERILTSQGHSVRHFLFINYQTSELIIREINSRDHSFLDTTIERIEGSILEHDYLPSITPNCQSCEFEILCST